MSGFAPSGCSGRYIQLTKRIGIKVYYCDYETRESAIKYGVKEAAHEAKMARKIRKIYHNVPRCFGVKILKIEDKWHVGILLQHLGDERISDVKEKIDPYRVVDSIRSQFDRRKIYHSDLHHNNVMYFKGKFWVIDLLSVEINHKRSVV